MEATAKRRYPVGRQNFAELRKNGYLYIDKTDLIYRLTHADAKYNFLSRPRRFGKSLLISTLHSYFEGRKDLFSGLAIEKLETEWEQYPVLHFDMSLAKHMLKEDLEDMLSSQLADHERQFGLAADSPKANTRLKNLIQHAYRQTGKQVVVLIDEYDAPLLDVVHEETNLPILRDVMRNFYSPLKACDPYLRFVFLTGITKFSQLSIFSELNNISNISMHPDYAALCGISQDEMLDQMQPDIDILAPKLGISPDEAIAKLKEMYDGYHFCWPSPDIYNPYSLLRAFSEGQLDAFWFETATPTHLIKLLHKFNISPTQLVSNQEVLKSDFDSPTENLTNITPLLYQSGYLTVKGYDKDSGLYQLNIPNQEIRTGLMRNIVTYYLQASGPQANTTAAKMSVALRQEDMNTALELLQTLLGSLPYSENTHYEGHYQQLLCAIFAMLGFEVDIESRTRQGRIDIVLRTPKTLYLIELKMNKDADAAMSQIDSRDYASRFALGKLPVVKVGIHFDTEKRNITNWKIEPNSK